MNVLRDRDRRSRAQRLEDGCLRVLAVGCAIVLIAVMSQVISGCGDDDTGIVTRVEPEKNTAEKIQEACRDNRVFALAAETERDGYGSRTSAWMVVCTTGEVRKVVVPE